MKAKSFDNLIVPPPPHWLQGEGKKQNQDSGWRNTRVSFVTTDM